MKSIDVFISGAGISGTITAILLSQMGLSVAVTDPFLDAQTSAHKSSRTAALMNESMDILAKAGIDQTSFPHSEDMRTLTIIDESIKGSQPVIQNFYAHELGQDRFGRNIFVNDLQHAALRIARHKKIIFLTQAIAQITPHDFGIDITLNDGTSYRAKLLIGADGRKSRVRDLMNIKTWDHDYEQTAITGIITHTKPHNHASAEFHRAGGPLTFVPLPDGQMSFVWMESSDDAKKILSLNKSDFIKELQTRSQNRFGTLDLISHLESWPISALKADDYIAPRCALIAETIHVISPIGAQGLNLSLRDIDDLVNAIADAASLGLDIGARSVLEQYKKARHNDIQARVRGTDILNRFVQMTPTPLKQIRRIGLQIAGNFLPLRQNLMREGLRGTKKQ